MIENAEMFNRLSPTAIEPDYMNELYDALTKKVELGGPAEPMQVETAETI